MDYNTGLYSDAMLHLLFKLFFSCKQEWCILMLSMLKLYSAKIYLKTKFYKQGIYSKI